MPNVAPLRQRIELYFFQVISGHRHGWDSLIFKTLLRGVSCIYRGIAFCRNVAFNRGWISAYRPDAVVISVGNIVAGGTGKTPITLMLATHLAQSFSLAILSRGYRSQAEYSKKPIVLHSGKGLTFPAAYCGDEPYLLSTKVPNAFILVSANRSQTAKMAVQLGAHIILLDDGMQHRKLVRDFDIVVIDARDPFGRGYFLPRGFLREEINGLGRAHLIVVNHVQDLSHFDSIKNQLKKYTQAPMVGMELSLASIKQQVDLKEVSHPVQTWVGKKVSIFCGIAKPEYFRNLVQKHGMHIVAEYFSADHMLPSEKKLMDFANHSKNCGAELLLCTEKDRVKLAKHSFSSLPVASTETHMHIIQGEEAWISFIDKVNHKVSSRK